MSHLIAIAIGPVQEFIAAARRTGDLWFGSSLLSKISREVAISVERNGGSLIFPASIEEETVANVILAALPAGDPREVAGRARQAAQECWLTLARDAWKEASSVIRQEIWDEQVDDVIELYAAWIERSDNYQLDRARVMRLLAGRKNCRDFQPANGRAGVPKSSLDGQRESVLKDPAREPWPERFRSRLKIREGEQLDVVALVKRVACGKKSYPSIARIAADPWVRANQHRLEGLRAACQQLGDQVIRPLNTREYPQFGPFPFEGTAVYSSRHHELIEETESTIESLQSLQKALARLPQPDPYLAILVADGDQIGAVLSTLESPDAHRTFSGTLSRFAKDAKGIVQRHHGVLVYAGGDDVLAFLPVDRSLDCARQLHDSFGETLRGSAESTLSVGIAIGHFMENLEDLLAYGRQAGKAAKNPDRNGLAVHLYKRGGGPIKVRGSWRENPDQRLKRFASLIREEIIPARLPYELRTLAHLYQSWNGNVELAIRQDLFRLIARKSSRGTSTIRQALDADLQSLDSARLMVLAEELLIARHLARTVQQEEDPEAGRGEVRS